MPDNRENIIRSLFAAYLANDRQRVADVLADDFRFTSPFDDDLDKATYFEPLLEGHRLDRPPRYRAHLRCR